MTPRKGTEDRGIDLKVWVRAILHTQTLERVHASLNSRLQKALPAGGGWGMGGPVSERETGEREKEKDDTQF